MTDLPRSQEIFGSISVISKGSEKAYNSYTEKNISFPILSITQYTYLPIRLTETALETRIMYPVPLKRIDEAPVRAIPGHYESDTFKRYETEPTIRIQPNSRVFDVQIPEPPHLLANRYAENIIDLIDKKRKEDYLEIKSQEQLKKNHIKDVAGTVGITGMAVGAGATIAVFLVGPYQIAVSLCLMSCIIGPAPVIAPTVLGAGLGDFTEWFLNRREKRKNQEKRQLDKWWISAAEDHRTYLDFKV